MVMSVSGGRLAITTSAVATNLATISRPSGLGGSRVIPSLPRLTWRYMAPTPSGVTGVTQRSSPPSMRSTRMTSAPRSRSSAPQYGPAMNLPKSITRTPSSTPMAAPFVRYGTSVRHCADGSLRPSVAHRAGSSLRPSVASARVRLVAGASLAAAPGGGVPAGAIHGVADVLRFTDEVRASAGAGVRLHVEVVPGEYH